MLILLLVLIVYVVSCYGSYKYIQIAHSKDGRWSNLSTDAEDVIFVFLPIVNTLNTVGYLFGECYRNNDKKANFNEFFKVFR
jgi:hypothetical protein